jgi:cytochrome c-type biogenesis protein CcmH
MRHGANASHPPCLPCDSWPLLPTPLRGYIEPVGITRRQFGGNMETFWFWTVAGGLALLVASYLARGLLHRAESVATASPDVQLYRDQLAETERDLARGTLSPADADRVRAEIARRLLDADRAPRATDAPAAPAPWAAIALVLAAIGGAAALYTRIGAPWYPDMALSTRLAMADANMAARPDQATAEASVNTAGALPPSLPADPEFEALMEKLRAAVDPATATDLRGLELLARNEASLGNFLTAKAAQSRLVTVKGVEATAEDHATLAEMMILAAGGYISPQAEAELIRALERDPQNGMAHYFSGLMFAQGGRFDRAFAIWRPLLQQSPPDAPWTAPLRAQIEEVAYRAGIPFTLPPLSGPPLSGPSAEDIDNAAEMSPEDRAQMIEGMVAQLQDRLATEGGSAEEWAQLISALTVLGRTDQAQTVYAEAQTRFAGRDEDLATLTDAAAGLTP